MVQDLTSGSATRRAHLYTCSKDKIFDPHDCLPLKFGLLIFALVDSGRFHEAVLDNKIVRVAPLQTVSRSKVPVAAEFSRISQQRRFTSKPGRPRLLADAVDPLFHSLLSEPRTFISFVTQGLTR